MAQAVSPLTGKGQATRARLLAAARAEALDTAGSVEVAKVAARAAVVPSLVYRYFGSKTGLMTGLVDDFFDRLHAEVLDLELAGHGGWAQRERMRLELGVRFHYDEPFAVVLYTMLGRDPQVARAEATRIVAVVEQVGRNIRDGQAVGEVPLEVDPRLTGAAAFGAMQQVVVEALGRRRRPTPGEIVDILWRQFAASVRIEGAATKLPGL
jgi:AcrR family transcriptional regulator